MGVYDGLRREYPLPLEDHERMWYQTTDFNKGEGLFTITRDGRLVHGPREWIADENHPEGGFYRCVPGDTTPVNYTGDVEFETFNDGEFSAFRAGFVDGQLARIERFFPLLESGSIGEWRALEQAHGGMNEEAESNGDV